LDQEGEEVADFDVKRYTRQDQIVIGTSLLAFIALFLPWYGASADGFSASISGWSTSYGWLGGLLVVAGGVIVLLHRAGVIKLPAAPVGPAVLLLGLSAIGTVIVILRWATLPRGGGGVAGVAVYHYGPGSGIYIALIAGVIQTVVAFTLFRASNETLPWKTNTPGSTTTSS
jgi:hypothetical protein